MVKKKCQLINADTSTTQQRSSTQHRPTLPVLRLVLLTISVLACDINEEWLLHWGALKELFICLVWATPVFPLTIVSSLYIIKGQVSSSPPQTHFLNGQLTNILWSLQLHFPFFILTISVTCPSSLFLEMRGRGKRCRSWSQPRLRASFRTN